MTVSSITFEMEALALYERGCLSAAAEKLQRSRDVDGKLSNDCSDLYARIHQVRQQSLKPCVEFTSDAMKKEIPKLTVRKMQEHARAGTRMPEGFVRSLLGNDDEAKQILNNRGFSALYIESANTLASMRANMMQPLLMRNDRHSSWRAIRDGLRTCPFVSLWHGKMEVNDATVLPPSLVRLARLLEDPKNEEDDVSRANSMLLALDLNDADGEDARFFDDLWSPPPTRAEDENDIPTIRWWAAFLLIDAKRWMEAQEIIRQILFDCTLGDRWPGYYLPEALFLAAMAEFALERRETCAEYLDSYFDLAEPMDRNRADAKLLHLWARDLKPPRPPTLQCLCFQRLRKSSGQDASSEMEEEHLLLFNETEKTIYQELPKLRDALGELWDNHTFSTFTWLRLQISQALELEEENPYLSIKAHLERSWSRLGRRPKHVNDTLQRMEHSCGRTITIRHWEPKKHRGHWEF